jgi:peptidoglycan hydrolase CwlO-like protein
MQNSKKWSIIALASVVLVSVAYFGSTGQISRLGSSALTTTNTCTESAHAAQAEEYTTKIRLKAQYVAQVAALIQSNNNLSSQARSTRNKISDYQNQINDIQKKINPLKKYIDEKCSLPTRLRPSDCTNKKNQLNNLYDDIEHRNSRIKDLQKDVKRFDSTVAQNSSTIMGLNSSIVSLTTFINSYEQCDAELKKSADGIVFARDTSVDLSKSYAKGANDVTLAKGTITAKTPVTLENIVLDYASNAGANTGAVD